MTSDGSKRRPAIPAHVRRAVLVEAGHTCAIPRCGQREIEVHHIIPWSQCKNHDYSNLIALCLICHSLAHKGQIDRKSLIFYKSKLQAALQVSGSVTFSAPPVEIRRQIFEVEPADSDCFFSFEFPDFVDPKTYIVSKNIEAWGIELLQEFRHSQDVEHRNQPSMVEWPTSWINAWYEVRRKDAVLISILYDIELMPFRAAHRSRETRVQNFMLDPFVPLSIDELLLSPKHVEDLARLVRGRLIQKNANLHEELVRSGTSAGSNSFSKFVIDKHGFTFIYDEYQVASYADGRQHADVAFTELVGVFKAEYLQRLAPTD